MANIEEKNKPQAKHFPFTPTEQENLVDALESALAGKKDAVSLGFKLNIEQAVPHHEIVIAVIELIKDNTELVEKLIGKRLTKKFTKHGLL